jgi:hippurate hydrolase
VILDGVRRAADGIAASHGLPDDRKPIVTIIEAETGRANINNPVLAARVKKAISAVLGADKVDDGFAIMGSEDFTQFGLPDRSIPTLMFNVGVVDHVLLAKSKEGKAYVPGQHTSKFAPLPEPTLRASIKAMTAAAIALLQK